MRQREEQEDGEALEEIFRVQAQKARLNKNSECKSLEHQEPRLA